MSKYKDEETISRALALGMEDINLQLDGAVNSAKQVGSGELPVPVAMRTVAAVSAALRQANDDLAGLCAKLAAAGHMSVKEAATAADVQWSTMNGRVKKIKAGLGKDQHEDADQQTTGAEEVGYDLDSLIA